MNQTMSPRLGLVAEAGDGFPILPPDVAVGFPDGSTAIVPVWRTAFDGTVGSHASREYRDDQNGQLAVSVKLAACRLPDGRAGVLAIAWVPALSRGADNALYDLVMSGPTMAPSIAATWPVVVNDDGSLTVPALDADSSPAGLVAQAAWPAGWRLRLSTDSPGDPMNGIPSAPATGPRCIAEVLA